MRPLRFALAAAASIATATAVATIAVPDDPAPAPHPPPACSPQSPAVVDPEPPRWHDGTIGAAGGISFPGNVLVDTDADLARQLDGVRDAGARWVRVDVDWSHIEASRGHFEWCRTDRFVRAARTRGLDVIAILTYAPGWATGGDDGKLAPHDPADYAAFATAAVTRYSAAGVHAWEVWNEPNIAAFWKPRPDPAAYAQLLHAAAPAIRAADPDSLVISGGLAPAPDSDDGRFVAPETFLRAMYEAGAGADLDAVGYHPYSFPLHPLQGTNAFSRLPAVHALMEANGDGAKQLWLTEFGAPTGGGDGAVPDVVQADVVAEGYEALRAWPWAGPMLWYSYRDLGTDTSDVGQGFGLVRNGFGEKPALDAFAHVMAEDR